MSARLRPLDTLDPGELHRILLRAHARSGSTDRMFTAQRIADRVRMSAVAMGVALDVLAAAEQPHRRPRGGLDWDGRRQPSRGAGALAERLGGRGRRCRATGPDR